MNILTYFDQNKISDGWRVHVDNAFGVIHNANIVHTDTLEDLLQHMKNEPDDIVVFGFSDGLYGTWKSLVGRFTPKQIPVLITKELNKDDYRKAFFMQTGRALEILDAVNFYNQAEVLRSRLFDGMQQPHGIDHEP